MNPRNLLFVVASVIVMGASFTLMSQGLTDGVRVTLPYPVTVDDVVLEPGEYEIRRASSTTDQVLRFFNKDELRYQTVALTIPVEEGKTPEETKVLLHHIGDKYYFDKIWIHGKDSGYEFPLPDRVRALQRELAVTGAATTQAPAADSTAAVQQPNSQPVEKASEPESAQEAVRPSREIQPLDTRVESESAESRQQVAVIEQEQRETPAPGVDSRQDSQQGQGIQRSQNVPAAAAERPQDRNELPATASNWFAYMLGGSLLLVAAGLLRRTASVQS